MATQRIVSATTPLDLAQIYMTPQSGFGQRRRLDTIDRKLTGLPIRPVLYALAQIASLADSSIGDRALQTELVNKLFPTPLIHRALECLQQHAHVVPMSSQVVLTLATRSLIHCQPQNDMVGPPQDRLTRQLGDLLLSLADHTSSDSVTDQHLQLELARLGLYFQLNDLSAWYDVAAELLFEVLPAMTQDRDFVDADQTISAVYGLDLELLWALTAAHGVVAREQPKGFELSETLPNSRVSPEQMASWRNVWSINLDDARRRAIDDAASSSWWSFTALYDRPILQLNENRWIAIRPAFLANKATPSGMFWAVRNAYVKIGGEHGRWAQLFGRAIENLGRRYLSTYIPEAACLSNEEEIRSRWGPGRACDFVVLGAAWIAIDFVHHQITRDTATTGDFNSLLLDIERAVTSKLVRQIDETLRRGLETEQEQPDAIFPVVIVGSVFPINPILLGEVERQVAAKNPAVIGVDSRCRQPAILELHELSLLLEVSNATGESLPVLLESWLSSPLGGNSFRDWLVTDGRAYLSALETVRSNRWGDRMRRRLFDHPFPA